MVLAYIVLQMDIDMRELGMKEEGNDLVCIHSQNGDTQSGH